MVEAARKSDRICQVGTQSRSNPGMREAIAYVHGGGIGKVSVAYGTCYKSRPSIGDIGRREGEQPVPKTMDYDLWCGPAKVIPPKRNNPKDKFGTVHYNWHWIWEYGNGDLGNQGVHEMDKARWGLNVGLPTSVVSAGGRFGYEDDGETANTQLCLFEYPGDAPDLRGPRAADQAVQGGRGRQHLHRRQGLRRLPELRQRGGVRPGRQRRQEVLRRRRPAPLRQLRQGRAQPQDRRTSTATSKRDTSRPRCATWPTSATGSAAKRRWRRRPSAFAAPEEAAEALGRMKDHLKENGVDLAKAKGRVGPKLAFDAKAEKFTGGEAGEANKMLTREYRKGFDINEASLTGNRAEREAHPLSRVGFVHVDRSCG